jgi:NTP pyrophosphatase (non-canonical NTP hydrolase)
MNYEELATKIEAWANERNLIQAENATKQTLKLMEESGELAAAILKNDKDLTIDAIGDCLVVITILCKQLNLDPVLCLESAYNEIKDRKGKTENGTFIKNS